MQTLNRFLSVLILASFGGSLAVSPANAQQKTAEKSAIDQEAMAALQKMGAYLRTLKAFQVEAKLTDEDVLESGQKIQYSGTANVLAQAPSRLRAEMSSDRRQRLYLFDGKNFTLVAQRLNYYATVPAPDTIAKLVDKLDDSYDLSMPMEDLFRWGTPAVDTSAVKAAMVVGPSEVEGTTCVQYAFRQDDVDWQIWIQRGDFPLPRKLVITTNTDDAKPQHTAVYTWNLAPSFNEAAFVFTPSPDSQRVVLAGSTFAPADKPAANAKK